MVAPTGGDLVTLPIKISHDVIFRVVRVKQKSGENPQSGFSPVCCTALRSAGAVAAGLIAAGLTAAATHAGAVDETAQCDTAALPACRHGIRAALHKPGATDNHAVIGLGGGVAHQHVTLCIGQCDRALRAGGKIQQNAALRGRRAEILRHAGGADRHQNPARDGCRAVIVQRAVTVAGRSVYIGLAARNNQISVGVNPITAGIDIQFATRNADINIGRSGAETVVLLSRETNPLTVEVRMEVETGEVKEHPTYKRIQEYVQEKYGFKVHTAYIAEVKRMVGLDMHKAPNAVEQRKHEYHPCPPEKVEAIKDALRHFGLISE